MLRKLLLLSFVFFTANIFSQSFEAVWDTEQPGLSAANEITIPTNPAFTNYNYTVNWGDGNTDTGVTGNITHQYAAPGQYTIAISGDFPAIYFDNAGDRLKIIEILSWGTIQWQTMEDAFHGCQNLNFDAIGAPDLSQATSLRNMFRGSTSFNGILNNWDVITINDISGMFANCFIFNRPLDNWNTINITNMSETFLNAELFNEPLDNWRVDNVTDMSFMFAEAQDFNQNINNWSVNSVTNMSNMFFQARAYNQPLDNWRVDNVTNMSGMLRRTQFNRPINNWIVDNVTDMSSLFAECPFNQPLDNWNVSNVTNMSSMFRQNREFNQPLNVWDVSSVTSMSAMFSGFASTFSVFNQPLDQWDVSNVEFMTSMFQSSEFNQPLNDWVVTSVTSMARMFEGHSSRNTPFNQPLNNWVTTSVNSMNAMFSFSDFNQPIEVWDVSNVDNMSQMFARNTAFDQPLNGWTISALDNISAMFSGATSFNQDLSNWDTANIRNMSSAFFGASAFDQNLGVWNISSVTNMTNMLSNSGLSQENYDSTLIGWAAQTVNENINLGANGLQYCDSRLDRESLIENIGWTITGDAINCTNVFCTTITSPLDTDTNVPANSDIRWEPAPNADGYRVTLRRENGAVSQIIYDNQDFGNVVGLSFTNEFTAGDTIFVTVVPYNDEGPAEGCEEISFTVVASWQNSPDAYKITIDTRLNGISTTPNNQFEMQRNTAFTYNYSIDWGDGQYTNNVNNNIIHTYLTPGIYTIAIIGEFPAPFFRITGDSEKVTAIEQWGTQEYLSMESACYYCENMVYNATDIPDLSRVESMHQMFNTARLFNADINNWDVSNVKDMSSLFGAASAFNQPLNSWVVDNVENMQFMFASTASFNQPLDNWNTGNVTTMRGMFVGARAFNQNINGWDVSNVTDMESMFEIAEIFNQPLDDWDTANVTNMAEMFRRAESFNQNINSWDVSNVTNMMGMFDGFVTDMIFNQPLNNWDTGNVFNMAEMFQRCVDFNQPLNMWDVGNVTTMFSMFDRATSFNQNIDSWNVTNVVNMESMFQTATSFNSPLNSWDVNSVVNMSSMFRSASAFNQPLNNWDTSAVANTSSMFERATAFNQNINPWDVSSVTLMQSMFESAAIFNSPLNDWNVSSVTNMQEMFKNAIVFDQALNNWDTGEVLTMQEMFSGASAFNQPLNNWDVSFVTTMEEMFKDAIAFNQNLDNWNVASVNTMRGMFEGATAFNGIIDPWNVRSVTTMENMFFGATSFNQTVNNWRILNVQNMDNMFRDATSFNQDLNRWVLGNVSMNSMFNGATSYNQNFSDWDVSGVSNMTNMLDNTALVRENYDNTLIAWSEQNLAPGITLGALTLPYCDALEERQLMIDTFGWSVVGDVLDCPIPECTVLISPLNGATNVPVNTNLSWSPALFARGYRLTVGTTPGGNDIVNNETINNATSYEFLNDFTGGETVYVTLIPFNDEGNATGPCIEESFTISSDTAAVPDCTNLTEPLNTATDVLIGTDLSWNPIANADEYILIVGTSTGANDILDSINVGNVTTYDLPTDLPENTEIFVTIVPINEEGAAVSCTEESFTTELIPVAPNCTTLSSPLDEAINVPTDADISWNAVEGATGYLISIGTTPNGINIANNIDVLNTTTYDIPDDLQPSRTHYVTIIPYNDIGDAVGCAEETFTTASLTPDCTTLISPLNNAVNVPTTLNQITWNAVDDATSYIVSVSGTANNDITNFETTDTFLDFTNPFSNGEVVSVTINPVNSGIGIAMCTSESFTIIPTTPDCTTLASPLNNAVDVATTLNQITWNAVDDATAYQVTITGTANNNVTNFETTDTFFDFTNPFENSEVVTVTIVPVNATVTAESCTSESFTIIAETPDCTTLSSPLNNAVDVPTTLNQITWNTVDDATAYQVTITGTANNDVTNFETTDTFFDFTNPFENSEVVTVTIIPINGTVPAESCTTESFTIIAETPDCTTLISPLNNAVDVATTLNQITWNAVDIATAYQVTITGTANNDVTNFETTDTFFNFTNPFENEEVVTVTIVPINGTVLAESCTSESFTIIAETPDCTTLISPLNNAVDVATNLNQITWNAVEIATAYQVTITGTANNDVTNFETTDTFFDFTNTFENEEVVTVTIVPINGTVAAESCTSESFTIIAETPDCTTLTSPLNNAVDVATNLNQITWNAVDIATAYQVTITGTANNDVTNFETTDTFFNFTNLFENEEVVTVTIVPINGTVPAESCTTESFTIIAETPDCTTLISPLNNAVDVATNLNQITWNAVDIATAYQVTITGTANNDVTNFETTDTFFDFTNPFENSEVVTVTITPINGTVSAESCTSESFTIIAETPDCTTLASPLNNAVDVPTTLNQITWNAVDIATAYQVTITGTANNDVTNFETTDTFFNFTNPFENEEVVTVTIVPINGTVLAESCTSENFTIIAETPDCTTLTSPLNNETEVSMLLNQITWNAVDNATAYLVTITGTANNDVTDFETTDTFFDFTNPFEIGEEVIVTITPVNGTILAESCASESFIIESVPECTSLTSPFNEATDVAIETDLTWGAILNAEGYFLSVGTTPGGFDVVDNEDVGFTTSYSFNDDLEGSTTYYVTVIPYNLLGEAFNCEETTFTTLELPKNDVKFGFSPNGDGVNDYWDIEGMEEHPENTVTIYNRWGDVVFQINNYNNSTNVFRGVANRKTKMGAGVLPDGTYFFQFTINEEHNFESLKGYVVIKR